MVLDSLNVVLIVGLIVYFWLVKLNCCELEVWVGCLLYIIEEVIEVVE